MHIYQNIPIICIERNGYKIDKPDISTNVTLVSNCGERTMSSTLIRSINNMKNINKYVYLEVSQYILSLKK